MTVTKKKKKKKLFAGSSLCTWKPSLSVVILLWSYSCKCSYRATQIDGSKYAKYHEYHLALDVFQCLQSKENKHYCYCLQYLFMDLVWLLIPLQPGADYLSHLSGAMGSDREPKHAENACWNHGVLAGWFGSLQRPAWCHQQHQCQLAGGTHLQCYA